MTMTSPGSASADGVGDRPAAIHLDADVGPLDAAHDLGDDRLGVLGARGCRW